jgi:hypothetical protein
VSLSVAVCSRHITERELLCFILIQNDRMSKCDFWAFCGGRDWWLENNVKGKQGRRRKQARGKHLSRAMATWPPQTRPHVVIPYSLSLITSSRRRVTRNLCRFHCFTLSFAVAALERPRWRRLPTRMRRAIARSQHLRTMKSRTTYRTWVGGRCSLSLQRNTCPCYLVALPWRRSLRFPCPLLQSFMVSFLDNTQAMAMDRYPALSLSAA